MAGVEATERALMALLRASGMRVQLRVAQPAAAGDADEQLGLASPGFEDREIGHGVFRKANSTRVLFVEARADASMFVGAVGVVIGEEFYRIEACEALRAGNGVYGYALTLADLAR